MTKDKYPLISIVTPNYQGGATLEQTIRSVLHQDYPRFEHIIIDGASQDESVEIIQRYPHLYWKSQKDTGQAAAINEGLSMARGDIVAFINSDDYYTAGTFWEVSRTFLEEDVDFVFGSILCLSEKSAKEDRAVVVTSDFDSKRIWERCFVPQPGLFFHPRILRKEEAFQENLHFVLDYEFLLRHSREGRFRCLNRVQAVFRISDRTKTGDRANRKKAVQEMVGVIDRLDAEGAIPEIWQGKEGYLKALHCIHRFTPFSFRDTVPLLFQALKYSPLGAFVGLARNIKRKILRGFARFVQVRPLRFMALPRGRHPHGERKVGILYVSSHFYPSGVVGARRAVKMTKYLRRMGVPVEVLHLPRRFFSKLDWKTDSEVDISLHEIFGGRFLGILPHRYLMMALVSPGLLLVQRYMKFWNQSAIAIFTGPDFYHFLGACFWSRLTGLKYFLDYRDEWALFQRESRGSKNGLFRIKNRILCFLESRVIGRATGVVFANKATHEKYLDVLGGKKSITIPNGIDEEDYRGIRRRRKSEDVPLILLSGKLFYYDAVIGNALMKAFQEVKKQKVPFEVLLLNDEPEIDRCVKAHQLESFVNRVSYVSYQEALQWTADADICLCLTPDRKLSVGTKIFEYLAFERPVLFLEERWEALEGTGLQDNPYVNYCDGRSSLKIAEKLRSMLSSPVKADGKVDLNMYSRKRSAKTLARFIEETAGVSLNVFPIE